MTLTHWLSQLTGVLEVRQSVSMTILLLDVQLKLCMLLNQQPLYLIVKPLQLRQDTLNQQEM